MENDEYITFDVKYKFDITSPCKLEIVINFDASDILYLCTNPVKPLINNEPE